jgi:hypothetical protein
MIMQRFFSICAILMLVHSGVVLAYPSLAKRAIAQPSVRTSSNKDFSIDGSGYVYDSGTLLGQIDSSGYVRDASGSIIGKIDEIGYVRDADDRILGEIDDIGYIRDANDQIIGQIDSNNYLYDRNGNYLGTVNSRELVIFMMFFSD